MLNPTAPVEAAAARQIVIRGGSTTSVIVYRVPEGRKFIGRAVSSSTGTRVYINGIECGGIFTAGSGSNIAGTSSYPNSLELLAGTMVSMSSTSGTLIGIEYDA